MTSRRLAALATLVLMGMAGSPGGLAGRAAPDAEDILRRAEEARSPNVDYAVDFKISVLDDYSPGVERKGSYAMLAHGKDLTMILMLTPSSFYGGTLLMQKGAYWLLLPRATRSYQLSAQQILRGDVANGDLARVNLLAEFAPRLDGEETIDGEPCWKLELKPRSGLARYSRVLCWIAKKKFQPRKMEYYGMTGAALKTAFYEDYRKTALGMRSMRMKILSPDEGRRTTTMVFSDLRKIDASRVEFTPEGMAKFRDAALAEQEADGTEARLEEVVARVSAAKS